MTRDTPPVRLDLSLKTNHVCSSDERTIVKVWWSVAGMCRQSLET